MFKKYIKAVASGQTQCQENYDVFFLSEIPFLAPKFFLSCLIQKSEVVGRAPWGGTVAALTSQPYWQPRWRQDTPVTNTTLPADVIVQVRLLLPSPPGLGCTPPTNSQRGPWSHTSWELAQSMSARQAASDWEKCSWFAPFPWKEALLLHEHPSGRYELCSTGHKTEEQTFLCGEHSLRTSACLCQSYQTDRETPQAF